MYIVKLFLLDLNNVGTIFDQTLHVVIDNIKNKINKCFNLSASKRTLACRLHETDQYSTEFQ